MDGGRPDVKTLCNELVSVSDWRKLGLNLGVQDYELDKIERSHPGEGCDGWKRETFSLWLQCKPSASWRDVVRALQQMGENSVAEWIKQKYIGAASTLKPTERQLMIELHNTVANNWRPIGTFLEIPIGELNTIATRERGDPQKCLMEMLGVWLRRLNPPASWPDIAEAVEFTGRPDIAQQIRQKYCVQSSSGDLDASKVDSTPLGGKMVDSPQVKAIEQNAIHLAGLICGNLTLIANDLKGLQLLSDDDYDRVVNTKATTQLKRANDLLQCIITPVKIAPTLYQDLYIVLEKYLNPQVLLKILPKPEGVEISPSFPDVLDLSGVDSTPLGLDDLFDVQEELIPVCARWKSIGIALRLMSNILDRTEVRNRGEPIACLTTMVAHWLKRKYNVERFGEPTWQMLVEAVAHPAGGANTALAREIARRHKTREPPVVQGVTSSPPHLPQRAPSGVPVLSSSDVLDLSKVDSTPLDLDDLFDVRQELLPVCKQWLSIGFALRLKISVLDDIRRNGGNPTDCLTSVVKEWLNRKYRVEEFGEPTWQRLVEAVSDPAGGANMALARDIAQRHKTGECAVVQEVTSSPPPLLPEPPVVQEVTSSSPPLLPEPPVVQAVTSSPPPLLPEPAVVQGVTASPPPLLPQSPSGSIRGVEVIGETAFKVSNQGAAFQWEGYGLKLHVQDHSLPGGMEEAGINIRASVSGQFQLPQNTVLLSPVFWISAPCKFTRPVTLEIQHCALREDETVLSDLHFVSARCSQTDLPYKFRQLYGGVFTTHSSYGSIQLTHFSGVSIKGSEETPRLYCAHLYHTIKQIDDWRYYLAITQDLEAHITAVQNHYNDFAKRDSSTTFEFEENKITLNIPEEGKLTKEGWKITPNTPTVITKREADEFKKGKLIRDCELMIEWEKGDAPVRLKYKLVLNGASAPKNFLRLVLNPKEAAAQGSTSQSQKHSTIPGGASGSAVHSATPELRDLLDALQQVAYKWKTLGIFLKIQDTGRLNNIEAKHHDPEDCLREMLQVWLKQVDPPPTWASIINALDSDSLKEQRLAKELREKYATV